VGDLPELIKGKNVGILATSVSTTAFAEAIRESLNKSPAHFGKEIENVAHIFNIKNIVNQFINTIFLNRT
jgi:hypothetical protein